MGVNTRERSSAAGQNRDGDDPDGNHIALAEALDPSLMK